MKVFKKVYKETIIVECDDHERLDTTDWLTNQGFEFDDDPERQMRSNEFHIEAYKKTVIYFSEGPVFGLTKLEAARNFLENKSLPREVRVHDDEDKKPKEIETSITDHPIAISFKTRNIGEELHVYIEEKDGKFQAIGWSRCY